MSQTTRLLNSRQRALMLYVIQLRDYSGAEISQLALMRADIDALLACPAGSRTEAWARGQRIRTVALPHHTLRHSGGRRELLLSVVRGLRSAFQLRSLLRRHPERRVVYGISLRLAMLASVATVGSRRHVVWVVGAAGRLRVQSHFTAYAQIERLGPLLTELLR